MRQPDARHEWDLPSHSEIRTAINSLGEDGFDEVREALTSGCEPFGNQMDRRMKTRRTELRPAYKVLRDAGADKVRQHLAHVDHEGLTEPRSRRRKPDHRSALTAS